MNFQNNRLCKTETAINYQDIKINKNPLKSQAISMGRIMIDIIF